MKQRQVQDESNLMWDCVEAFSGISPETAEGSHALSNDDNVTVVCTPSGKAQTVRLNLSSNWLEKISDDELLKEIKRAQNYRVTT